MPFHHLLPAPEFLHRRGVKIALAIFIAAAIGYSLFFSAPEQFPKNDLVVIPPGVAVKTAGDILSNRKIVRSPALFTVLASFFGNGGVQAGGYLFQEEQNIFTVSFRLARGIHNLETIHLTFPEGISVKEMAALCVKTLPLCRKDEFISMANGSEGYLFPDTYFFLQSADTAEVVKTMRQTFAQKMATLDKEVRLFGKPLGSVIVMASILEKEARYFEDRQMVASILWKRLELGMALQVDATLDYALNKNTYELTSADLATSSPFNTYKYKDLPPAPISNPGLESIKAALSPKPTKYLYYLTDRAGRFYYAETHEKHLANKARYLNGF